MLRRKFKICFVSQEGFQYDFFVRITKFVTEVIPFFHDKEMAIFSNVNDLLKKR